MVKYTGVLHAEGVRHVKTLGKEKWAQRREADQRVAIWAEDGSLSSHN
jgi:hypothetical protein